MFRRQTHIDQEPRLHSLCLPRWSTNRDSKSEVVSFRDPFIRLWEHLDGDAFGPGRGMTLEGQFGLPFSGVYSSTPRAVSLEAPVQFTSPFFIGLCVKRQIPLRGLGVLPFEKGLWRITKDTCAHALGEHCATLRADFIHRCVLRCGRSHSGEEEPF